MRSRIEFINPNFTPNFEYAFQQRQISKQKLYLKNRTSQPKQSDINTPPANTCSFLTSITHPKELAIALRDEINKHNKDQITLNCLSFIKAHTLPPDSLPQYFIENGVVESLIGSYAFYLNSELKILVLSSLGNLCAYSTDACFKVMYTCNIIPIIIIEAHKINDCHIELHYFHLLKCIAQDSVFSRNFLYSMNITDLLMRVIPLYLHFPTVIEQVSMLISYLLKDRPPPSPIHLLMLQRYCCQFLFINNDGIVEYSLKAILHVVDLGPDYIEDDIKATSIIKKLCSLISSENDNICNNAILIIGELCSYNINIAKACIDNGALEYMSPILKSSLNDSKCCNACWAISNIACEKECIPEIYAKGIYSMLCEVSQSGSAACRYEAMVGIANGLLTSDKQYCIKLLGTECLKSIVAYISECLNKHLIFLLLQAVEKVINYGDECIMSMVREAGIKGMASKTQMVPCVDIYTKSCHILDKIEKGVDSNCRYK